VIGRCTSLQKQKALYTREQEEEGEAEAEAEAEKDEVRKERGK
jgi:hypothetical protein